MARLTDLTYLKQHRQLKKEWFSESGGAFIMLSANEQWDLHAYFEFTKKLSDDELLVYRELITDKSLPQTACKARSRTFLFITRSTGGIQRVVLADESGFGRFVDRS